MGVGYDSTQPNKQPALPWTPGDLMLTLYLENDGFLTVTIPRHQHVQTRRLISETSRIIGSRPVFNSVFPIRGRFRERITKKGRDS